MANGITIEHLNELCKREISNGNANKMVFISQDDEGNGFHQLFYSFLTDENEVKELFESTYSETNGVEYKDIAILG